MPKMIADFSRFSVDNVLALSAICPENSSIYHRVVETTFLMD
jgi:hypothetical protein